MVCCVQSIYQFPAVAQLGCQDGHRDAAADDPRGHGPWVRVVLWARPLAQRRGTRGGRSRVRQRGCS